MPLNPDSIPTSEQVQETLFDRFYEPYKKQIWAAAALFAAGILVFLGVREWRIRQLDDQWRRFDSAMSDRGAADAASAMTRRIELLEKLVADYPAAPATPFALLQIAFAYAELERFDDALRALDSLRSKFKDFVANTVSMDARAGDKSRAITERLESILKAEKDWKARTAYVHPTPHPDRQALVETSAGNFWIGFFPDHAPLHVESFVQTAKSGFYNGTQVYAVRRTTTGATPGPHSFEAGSAASRATGPEAVRDPGAHDADEPGHTIDPEDSRFTIRHRRGIVTTVSMPSGESSRRFLVVCAEQGLESSLNGSATPFATVLDKESSFQTVSTISLSPTYGTDPTTEKHPETSRMRDHPFPPLWIRRVTIWSKEKLEDGHTFDTSRAGSNPPQPEPWEADLPKEAPRPEEFAPK